MTMIAVPTRIRRVRAAAFTASISGDGHAMY